MKTAAWVVSIALMSACRIGHSEPRFPNPMYSDWSTADPSVLRSGDQLYVYSTGMSWTTGGAYPIRVSNVDDRASWTQVGTVFPRRNLPPWSTGRRSYWAPEVHLVEGKYICYFSSRDKDDRFCIGAATASTPGGPFEPLSTPLVSDPRLGLIDASYFRDPVSGRSFLLWKEDSNDLDPQEPTNLVMQELEPNGLSVKGKPQVLLFNDQAWEGVLVEAPSMIYRDGYYYLFFSGNAFADDRYGVGVARSKSVTGPFHKFPGNPILRSDERFSGPGHQFLYEEAPGEWTMFYHARDKTWTERATSRLLMSDAVQWRSDGWPFIHDGTPSEGWDGWETEAEDDLSTRSLTTEDAPSTGSRTTETITN